MSHEYPGQGMDGIILSDSFGFIVEFQFVIIPYSSSSNFSSLTSTTSVVLIIFSFVSILCSRNRSSLLFKSKDITIVGCLVVW